MLCSGFLRYCALFCLVMVRSESFNKPANLHILLSSYTWQWCLWYSHTIEMAASEPQEDEYVPEADEPWWLADFNRRVEEQELQQIDPLPQEQAEREVDQGQQERTNKLAAEARAAANQEWQTLEERRHEVLVSVGNKCWDKALQSSGRVLFGHMCKKSQKDFAYDRSCDIIDAMTAARPNLGFKIGVTRDPEHRYHNAVYGYTRQSGCLLIVLHGTDYEEATSMEASLIVKYQSRPKNYNRAPGGIGLSRAGGRVFVYLVFGRFELHEAQFLTNAS